MVALDHIDGRPYQNELQNDVDGGHDEVGETRVDAVGRSVEVCENEGAYQVRDRLRHGDQGEDFAYVRGVHQLTDQRPAKTGWA